MEPQRGSRTQATPPDTHLIYSTKPTTRVVVLTENTCPSPIFSRQVNYYTGNDNPSIPVRGPDARNTEGVRLSNALRFQVRLRAHSPPILNEEEVVTDTNTTPASSTTILPRRTTQQSSSPITPSAERRKSKHPPIEFRPIEEVDYVQHNQSQRTTTRQRLVSSTPQHFGHVDQATSKSQLEEGMAGFQLDADTHSLQRTHMQPYNQQGPFSIDETGNANARQRLSFDRETADTGHDPVITSNSFLYSETA